MRAAPVGIHNPTGNSAIKRWLRRLAAVLTAVPSAYFGAAGLGALLPANPGWQPPPEGITLYVRSNGVHTSLVVPVRQSGIDWRGLIRPSAFPGGIGDKDHLSFAWGHREFYLDTPRWRDLRAGVALRALGGVGGTLMHVEHLTAVAAASDERPLWVTAPQYRRLARFILASFDPVAEAAAPIAGYTASDRFYPAQGRYNLFRTSNAWTGEALRHAGIRMGLWTPFAQGIMWRFPVEDE